MQKLYLVCFEKIKNEDQDDLSEIHDGIFYSKKKKQRIRKIRRQ